MIYYIFKKLAQVLDQFGLDSQSVDLFEGQPIKEVVPSEWLNESLQIAYFAFNKKYFLDR